MSEFNQYPSEDWSGDLEASSGFTNQERIVAGMDDPEQESGYYYSPHDNEEEDQTIEDKEVAYEMALIEKPLRDADYEDMVAEREIQQAIYEALDSQLE